MAVTAVFTGLLYIVTDSYTQFTRKIFESQHEKYVFDVVGERAFEVAIPPFSSLRKFDEPQLRLRLKNLTALEFKRPDIKIYAEIYEAKSNKTTKTLVFAPFIGEVLPAEGTLVIEDRQNDVAFNLREGGFVNDNGVLKPQFELNRFFAQFEALSPGGVLWQLKEEK
jgi:hypothetical protein